jgi:septal ring factor EnvC (AmiA/AmiB activator)
MKVTFSALAAFLTIFASIIGVYSRLRAQLDQLQQRFEKMERRNLHADQETEGVKREQALQKTTVAVMAQQVSGIDRSITEMRGELKENNQLLRQFMQG